MNFRSRIALLAAGLALVCSAPQASALPNPFKGASAKAASAGGAWPQAKSDLKPDPAVRFGAGEKVIKIVEVETYEAYREEVVQSSTVTASSMTIDGGVGGIVF